MVLNKKYWLNEHGERYWYLISNPSITAHRPYHWVDRITYINEQSPFFVNTSETDKNEGHWTTGDRKFLSTKEFNHPTKYSEFKKEKHLWKPIKNFEKYAENLAIYKKYNII